MVNFLVSISIVNALTAPLTANQTAVQAPEGHIIIFTKVMEFPNASSCLYELRNYSSEFRCVPYFIFDED